MVNVPNCEEVAAVVKPMLDVITPMRRGDAWNFSPPSKRLKYVRYVPKRIINVNRVREKSPSTCLFLMLWKALLRYCLKSC